jgi:hypothetical protein
VHKIDFKGGRQPQTFTRIGGDRKRLVVAVSALIHIPDTTMWAVAKTINGKGKTLPFEGFPFNPTDTEMSRTRRYCDYSRHRHGARVATAPRFIHANPGAIDEVEGL